MMMHACNEDFTPGSAYLMLTSWCQSLPEIAACTHHIRALPTLAYCTFDTQIIRSKNG